MLPSTTTRPAFLAYDTITKDTTRFLRGSGLGPVVATPKILGSNFSVTMWVADAVEGESPTPHMLFGCRTGYLEPDEPHFGYQRLCRRLEARFKFLCTRFPAGSVVRLYGELFGGVYAGLDTPADVRPVQTAIQYDPDLQLVFYDLSVNGRYCDFCDARLVCRVCRIPFVPVLHRALTSDDLLAKVGAHMHDLWVPRPKDVAVAGAIPGNTGEGFILRLAGRHNTKMMVKVKAPKFAEVATLNPLEKAPKPLGADHVTEARVASVASKFPESALTLRNLPALVHALREDVTRDIGAFADVGPFNAKAFGAMKAFVFASSSRGGEGEGGGCGCGDDTPAA